MRTFSRIYVDNFLKENINYLEGNILDIGGKKFNKRGLIKFSKNIEDSIVYLNVDASTKPDFLADAENLPFENESFDTFMLIEIIEHLKNPDRVLNEAFRILKPNGIGLITCPFLLKVHADPYDFQRFTIKKLEQILEEIGFKVIKVSVKGNLFSTIHDLIYGYLSRESYKGSYISKLFFKFIIYFNFLFKIINKFFKNDNEIYLSNQVIVKKNMI